MQLGCGAFRQPVGCFGARCELLQTLLRTPTAVQHKAGAAGARLCAWACHPGRPGDKARLWEGHPRQGGLSWLLAHTILSPSPARGLLSIRASSHCAGPGSSP